MNTGNEVGQFVAVVEVEGGTPVNTVDEASYCVKCKFFFFFFIFLKKHFFSVANACFVQHAFPCNTKEYCLPLLVHTTRHVSGGTLNSFQRITLIGTCFLPSLVDDFPVNCYTRSGGIKILTTTQSTFSLEHVELVDTALH